MGRCTIRTCISYSEVREAEWRVLFTVTGVTFVVSLAWALAEIVRESRTNVESVKSDCGFRCGVSR